ncbi:hypothetical protein [Methylobacterium sp. J-068]|uniref:head-tail joining protein n=1 Tax=Methylobacterium sp. J-068 TaxID=2836649 RepID=UPI001FB89A24|nr:hypothetical protein [Methylobacterium sp. J-068]MCJ2034244.1 hypothetical protein [Methylobacterium sp. J-068]
MSVFGLAIDAIFNDPNMADDALWRVGGAGEGIPVRIIRKSPDGIVGLQGNQFDLNAMLLDVRTSEVASPAEGDTVQILDEEDGAPAETVTVTGLSKLDGSGLVRTCEVAPITEDDPDDP